MKNQTSIFTIMDTSITPTASAHAVEEKVPAPVAQVPEAQTPENAPKPRKIKAPKVVEPEAKNEDTPAAVKVVKPSSDLGVIYKNLVTGLRKFFAENGFKRCVMGLSGGVDSSLVLKIACDALGSANVTVLMLPELGLTKQENIDHSKMLCKYFGVMAYYQPINNLLIDFHHTPWRPTPKAHMNTKARIRSVLIYNFANTENALALGTSNKSEILLGYGTKYGDLAADVEVIGDLFKTDVIKLADYAGLPPEIVNKTPSAELSAGQTDEADLGATYADIDKVLRKVDLGQEECISQGLPPALVHIVFNRVRDNAHKSRMPEVIRAY